jgi:hypothetical protein
MPAIGRIANYSSLRKDRPRENQIYDSYFDRREAMPRFIRKPHNCVVQEGQTANFKCKVLAASPPVITWHFKNTLLNPSLKFMPKYSNNDYELRIGRAKIEDKGEYIVKAVNSFGSKEESAVLNVEPATQTPPRRAISVEPSQVPRKKPVELDFEGYQEPPDKAPHFVFHLRDRFIQEGVGFKLLASVEGKPAPTCSWTKDGKTLRPGDRYDIVYSLGICSLEISACDPSDAGRYSCLAENSKGSNETSCKVTVNERKSFKPSAIYLNTTPSSHSSSSYSALSSSSSYSAPIGGSGYSHSSSYSSSSTSNYRTTYRRTEQRTSSSTSYNRTRYF